MDILLKLDKGISDISLQDNDILGDKSLYTAVLVSLFTDKRADNADELPPEYLVGQETPDLRGFWGDAIYPESIGSKLWLLKREKQLPRVLVLAKQYAEESLAWLIRDGYCSKVTVDALNPAMGMLNLKVNLEVNVNSLPLELDVSYAWTFQMSIN